MTQFSTSDTDLKAKWGGILEWPFISKVHRNSLDGLKTNNVMRILKPFDYESLLELGCGLAEYQVVKKGQYTGLDNSFKYINFARRKYQDCSFVFGDASKLPFCDKSYDATLFACTAHHFSDENFIKALSEMSRVSRKFIIIDDQIKWPDQNRVSKFFYDLDRGTNNRTEDQLEDILHGVKDFKIILKANYKSFPGFYLHAVFVLEII